MARHLLRYETNALTFKRLTRQDLKPAQGQVMQLIDANQHDDFLIHTINNSAREILIVTPWLLSHSISIDILEAMKNAITRKISITIYTDAKFNNKRKNEMTEAISKLGAIGVKTVLVNNVHSKIVICDENIYCVGSFNWFSADRHGQYKNHETSIVYRGTELSEEIQILKNDLHKRTKLELPSTSGVKTT